MSAAAAPTATGSVGCRAGGAFEVPDQLLGEVRVDRDTRSGKPGWPFDDFLECGRWQPRQVERQPWHATQERVALQASEAVGTYRQQEREVGLTRGGRSGDDACRECSPDLLMSREQDSCSRARRLHYDPSLGLSVVGKRRRVFHQFELQNIDEETNRSVIVVNDESDEFQLRHLHVS